jgi:hypothetical protein
MTQAIKDSIRFSKIITKVTNEQMSAYEIPKISLCLWQLYSPRRCSPYTPLLFFSFCADCGKAGVNIYRVQLILTLTLSFALPSIAQWVSWVAHFA